MGPGSSVVVVLEPGGWDVTELAVEAALVEPVDPGESLELDVFDVAPRASAADEFGLVEAVHALGAAVVIRIADAADRRQGADSINQTRAGPTTDNSLCQNCRTNSTKEITNDPTARNNNDPKRRDWKPRSNHPGTPF